MEEELQNGFSAERGRMEDAKTGKVGEKGPARCVLFLFLLLWTENSHILLSSSSSFEVV